MSHDYDSPWKEAIENLFEEFMTFFFPECAKQIDWTRPPKFLDKELEKIARDAEIGRRYADKLVQVWLKTGESIEVFIHIEVQKESETHFPERMFIYHYRIFDRYIDQARQNKIASFAVLCFPDKKNQASTYKREFWGSKATFTFPVVKITDYRTRWAELEQDDNLFAVVVMAHLKAADVKEDKERKFWKFKLMKDLYQRGLERTKILELFKFIDWLIDLPEALNQQFWTELYALEEEKSMTYVTSIERLGIQKGFELGTEQGLEQGEQKMAHESIVEVLEDKFGEVTDQVIEAVDKITDRETLKAVLRLAAKSRSMDQFLAEFRP